MKKNIRKTDRSHALNAALALALLAVVVTGASDRRNGLATSYSVEAMRSTAEPTSEQMIAVALAAARDLLGVANEVEDKAFSDWNTAEVNAHVLSPRSCSIETNHPHRLHQLAVRLHNLPPPIV